MPESFIDFKGPVMPSSLPPSRLECPLCHGNGEIVVEVRPRVVTLCGSGRFREAFDRAEFEETLAGRIVLTIGCNTHDIARSVDLAKHKPALDELHLRKIDISDEVLILNVGGYIGESTRRELEYARAKGKVVKFLEPELAASLGLD